MTTMNVEKSKRGLPCLWESGGGYSNTGNSTIICNKYGQPKKAIYIKRRGELACDDHALIPLQIGDFIINANHHRGDFNISVDIVDTIFDSTKEKYVVGEFIEEIHNDISIRFGKSLDEMETVINDFPIIYKRPEPDSEICISESHMFGHISAIYKLQKEKEIKTKINTTLEYEFSNGEWDKDLPEFLIKAVEAAKNKATCYHCRFPYYIKEED